MQTERLIVLAGVFTMALGVSLTLSAAVLPFYGIALAGLACVAVPYLLHTHPAYSFSPVRMILPAGIALAAPLVAHQLGAGPFQLVGVFGPGALLYGVILAEYLTIRPSDPAFSDAARLLLTLTCYGVALAYFLLVYEVKERSLISGTLVAGVSLLLALRLLTLDRPFDAKTRLHAGSAGLIMAEIAWPLNYWILSVTAGGLALLVAFYVLVGLMRQMLAGELAVSVVFEFVTVSLAGLVVVFAASRL